MNKKQFTDVTEALANFLSQEGVVGLPDEAEIGPDGLAVGTVRRAHKALDETRKVGAMKRMRDEIDKLQADVALHKNVAAEAQTQFHHSEKGRAEDANELARLRERYPVLEQQLEALRKELRTVRQRIDPAP